MKISLKEIKSKLGITIIGQSEIIIKQLLITIECLMRDIEKLKGGE